MDVGQTPFFVRIFILKKVTEQELASSIFKKKYEECGLLVRTHLMVTK
jgi:hypothetical protein